MAATSLDGAPPNERATSTLKSTPGDQTVDEQTSAATFPATSTKQRSKALDSVKHLMASSKSYQDEEYTYFVSEYVEKGELFNHVKDRGRFPEPIAREFARQILEGVWHAGTLTGWHTATSL